MGLLREEVQIETLRNWAAYSDELAEICDVISVSARLSYCQGEISSVRELVLWRPSDGSRDHHSSRYSRAGSTQMTEHSRKVLVGFETAGHGNIQDTRSGCAQHLLRTLYSVACYTLVRCLPCRLAKHPRKVCSAQFRRLCYLAKSHLVFQRE